MKIASFLDSLPDELQVQLNELDRVNHESQLTAFNAAYEKGRCYLCGEPFDQMRSEIPCSHWLLRRAKFKKKDFQKIFSVYDYHSIAAFLRWCANKEQPLRNINDLESEKSDRKILSYSIRWKNIEWSFDCSKNDLAGHGGHHSSFPHYHFQMRIDDHQFINFNEFHIPFSEKDLFMLEAKSLSNVHYSFGTAGAGMQEAVEVDPEWIIEQTSRTENQDEQVYDLSTIISSTDTSTISGEDILKIFDEAEQTGKTFASVAHKRLSGSAAIRTIVSPAESIPGIARRTEHKPR